MNIQNKLGKLRKAKKLRPILVYCLTDQPGIDVPDSDYPHAERFLKSLFRVLKKEGFDVQINHWGSIFLIEPVRQIPVALSINKTVDPCLPPGCEERLKQSSYFQLVGMGVSDFQSNLALSYRAWRPGTKWRFMLLERNHEELIENLLREMKARVSSLVSSPRHSLPMKDKVSFDDVVTLLTYNYIKINGLEHKPAWTKEISRRWVSSCEIRDGYVYFPVLSGVVSYRLMKSDIALLKRILPHILEEEIVIS